MKNWSLDKIVIVGLVTSLMLTIVTLDIIAFKQGDMSIIDLGKEIIIGLFGYTSRGGIQALDHKQNVTTQSQAGEVEHTNGATKK